MEIVDNNEQVAKVWGFGINVIMEPPEPVNLQPIRSLFPHIPDNIFDPLPKKRIDMLIGLNFFSLHPSGGQGRNCVDNLKVLHSRFSKGWVIGGSHPDLHISSPTMPVSALVNARICQVTARSASMETVLPSVLPSYNLKVDSAEADEDPKKQNTPKEVSTAEIGSTGNIATKVGEVFHVPVPLDVTNNDPHPDLVPGLLSCSGPNSLCSWRGLWPITRDQGDCLDVDEEVSKVCANLVADELCLGQPPPRPSSSTLSPAPSASPSTSPPPVSAFSPANSHSVYQLSTKSSFNCLMLSKTMLM